MSDNAKDIEFEIKGVPFRLKYIPGGTFDMGDEHGDLPENCGPVQRGITIQPFWMGETLVTQAQWQAVMNEDSPAHFKGRNRPVEKVSWDDVQAFLKKLNATVAAQNLNRVDSMVFQLPSEAQWEYAARGGVNDGKRYAGSNNLKEIGWYRDNSNSMTVPVQSKCPNRFGLYDLTGNVWEWCQDDSIGHLKEIPKDGRPRRNSETELMVLRGGSWLSSAWLTRLAYRFRLNRDSRNGNYGFRLSRYYLFT